ncbi:MAG: DUF2194 domain-containing protein [Lachnospiraceae bacterium]|nr:DUF2194 domain-containing protein [Lachnospiraceae bacterium]
MMISRRNFFISLIIMGTIFFLFQFSQIVKDYGNDYSYNKYRDIGTPKRNEWKQAELNISDDFSEHTDKDYILFLGDEKSDIGSIVSQWTLYTKRNICVIDNLNQYSIEKNGIPEFLMIDSNHLDYDNQTEDIIKLADEGVSMIFLNLPEYEKIRRNIDMLKLWGVQNILSPEIEIEGVKLFSGFLFGGESIYQPQQKEEEKRQDLDLTIPWFQTSGGTKTYMVGLLDEYLADDEERNEKFPAIIWRNSLTSAQVFCVNGDFMSDTEGLGILSAMVYELSPYQLYPVVNAQNTLVVDFPLMANENNEQFSQIYSRDINSFQTDVIWPTLVTLAEKDKLQYTCFMTPKYDYSDPAEPSYDNYNTLLRLLGEHEAEIGISLEHADGISLAEKVAFDKVYYDGIENKYPATSAFLDLKDEGELEAALKDPYVCQVRTIACDADVSLPILSYITDDITLQSLTSNTKNFFYSKDLMLKSIETVLGYDNAKLTLSDVAWPKSAEDQWENIYNDMASSLKTFWRPFRVFDRTTLTESDRRVRTFLNMDSDYSREGNEITLNVKNTEGETCWFVLRTHGERIASLTGATYKEIEENAYLLELSSDVVKITLKDANAIN